jgi:tetratricopeptide (TPR) repeat protein
LAVLADAYGALVGLPESLVHALSEDDLIALLRSQGRLDPERCLGLAELLREEARVYDDAERFDESYPRNLKALRLYLELIDEDDELISDRIPGLGDVIRDLSGLDLPEPTADRLVAYLEREGQFDEAENVLLHRVESEPENAEVSRAAIEFYKRLSQKSDAELIVGGLTRDEVEEALQRFD